MRIHIHAALQSLLDFAALTNQKYSTDISKVSMTLLTLMLHSNALKAESAGRASLCNLLLLRHLAP